MEDSRLIRGKNLLKNLFLKSYRVGHDGKKGPSDGFIERDYEIAKRDTCNKSIPRSITIGDMIPSRHRDSTPRKHDQENSFNDDELTTTLRSTQNDVQRRYSSFLDSDGYDGIYGLPISLTSFSQLETQDSPIASVERETESEYCRRFPTLGAPIASSELSELTSLSSEAQVMEMNSSRLINGKFYDLKNVIRRNQSQTQTRPTTIAPVCNDNRRNPFVLDNRRRLTQSMHVTSNEKADQLVNLVSKMADSPATLTNSNSFANVCHSTANETAQDLGENSRIELNFGEKKKIAVFNSRNLKLTLANLKELFEKAFNLTGWNLDEYTLEIFDQFKQTYHSLDSLNQLTDRSVLRLVPEMDRIKKMTLNESQKNQYHKSNLFPCETLRSPTIRENYFILAKSPSPGHRGIEPNQQPNKNDQVIYQTRPNILKTTSSVNQNCTCPLDHTKETDGQIPPSRVPYQQGQLIYAYPGQLVQIGNTIFQIPHKGPGGVNSVASPRSATCPEGKFPNGPLNLEPVDSHHPNSTLSNSSLDSAYSTRSNASSENTRTGSQSTYQKFLSYQQEMKKLKSEITTLRSLQRSALDNFQSDVRQINKTVERLSQGISDHPRLGLSHLSTAIRQHIFAAKRNRQRMADWMGDLEVVINSLREDALSKWYRINNEEVEAFERQLNSLMEKLDKQKKQIPKLKEVWEDMKKLDNNERISLSEYLDTDESQLDQELQKCRKMNSTLFTIKRLGNVNKNKVTPSSRLIHTRKDPNCEDRKILFEQINSLQPNHKNRLESIKKYQRVYQKRKKMLTENLVLSGSLSDNDRSMDNLKKDLEDHVITEAFAHLSNPSSSTYKSDINQIDFEVSDDDDSDPDSNDDSSYETEDQFCLINQTKENFELPISLDNKTIPNTILKNRNAPQIRQHPRERLVFSKHVLIEDGREVTEINCPMSDVEDQSSLHDGNDSGVGFSPANNTSNSSSANNPWRPLNGLHPGNKVVDIFPKVRSYPRSPLEPALEPGKQQRSIIL